MGNQKTFIFDLDDTLKANHHDYFYPQLKFAKYVVESLGYQAPDLQSIVNTQVAIDKRRATDYGFGKTRFAESMVLAYRAIADDLHLPYTKTDEEAVYAIGMGAFDRTRWEESGLLKGTALTLDYLEGRGDELILLTKGDPKVQLEKILVSHLDDWFSPENTHIVLKKDSAVLDAVISGRDKSEVWHVGNSIRSDVAPSVEAKIGSIYIPCETWAFERDHNGIEEFDSYQRLHKLKTISDIISLRSSL